MNTHTIVIAFKWFVTDFTVPYRSRMTLAVISKFFLRFILLFTETARKLCRIFSLVFCLMCLSGVRIRKFIVNLERTMT